MPSAETLALADEYWEHRLSTDHLRSLWQGDLTHLAEWEDFSEEAVEARRRRLVDFAERAEAALAGAVPEDRALLETISFTARSWATQLVLRDEIEMVNHAIGFHTLVLTFLPRFPLTTAEHGEQYLEKVHRLPSALAGLAGRARSAAGRGVVPIRLAVSEVAASIDRQLGLAAADDPLLAQPTPTELSGTEATSWRGRLLSIVEDDVRPALAGFGAFLRDELLPLARSDDRPGICHVPGGADQYEELVWAHTCLRVSAEEVHRVGLEQVARLEEEYRDTAVPVLDVGDVGEAYRRLRDDETLQYRDGAALVADAIAALARAESSLGGWFGRLPGARCTAEESAQGPLAFYSRPAPDGSKPGTFYFNTSDPSAWGTYQLQAVTYHEGIPGHHLQLASAQEDDSLHDLHKELYVAAYNEGWGLYAERLADEMGLYTSDLARVGMLTADSMRACRLVVDTGMHALGWTRTEAIEYMVANSPLSRRQCEGEVDRYLGYPGQALGYMMGRLEIDRIRREAEQALGDRFRISDFHDVVLGTGTVPLPTLRHLVAAWASGEGAT